MKQDLSDQTEDVMRRLSDLSNAAERDRDDDLKFAANRAWRQLYDHQSAVVHARFCPPRQ